MGKNYVTIPMNHSWKELRLFAPWVTHGVELRAFIARKMPRSMHNMRPYIGKELRQLAQEDIPVTYKIIGYESHLDSSGVTRGAPCSYFTSNLSS